MIKLVFFTVFLLCAIALGLLYAFPQSAINIAIGLTVSIVILSVVGGAALYDRDYGDE